MKLQPLLSVIVANYNNEEYLHECLTSILEQTFKDLEIVVYDDGSTDGSLAAIRSFKPKCPDIIQVIHDPVNRGIALARHRAIVAARGEYLTTLDSDDFYCNQRKLENEIEVVRHFQEREKKEVISFSNVLLLKNQAPSCLWGNPGNICQGSIASEILGRSCFIPRDFVVKRDFYFQAGGFDSRFKVYEDWDLKIRLAVKHEFHFTNDVGTAYRCHGHGLSARPFSELGIYLRQVFEKNLPLAAAGDREAIRRNFEKWMADQGARRP